MGLPVIRTGNVALDRFLEQVRHYIEAQKAEHARPGADRVLRMSDMRGIVELAAAGAAQQARQPQAMEQFARDLAGTQLFKSLMRPGSALDGLVDGIPRAQWNTTRAERPGRSSAQASTNAIVAAEDNRAVAALVTDVQARLDNFYDDGSAGLASIEQAFLALADRQTGLMAQYTVKVTAGGAVAGFGLSATEKDGIPESAFIISADKFAIVAPSYSAGPNNAPAPHLMPFGVDTSVSPHRIYLNGTVLVNAQAKGIKLTADSYQYNASTSTPASITVTADLLGGLTGTPTFRLFGTGTIIPGSGNSRTISTSSLADSVIIDVIILDGSYTYKDSIGIARIQNGVTGATGAAGATGARGPTRTVRTTAGLASWSNIEADAAIAALWPHKVLRDEVTLRNSATAPTYLETRYWDGVTWAAVGVVIDGNLLVKGSITANALAADAVLTNAVRVESDGQTGTGVTVTVENASHYFVSPSIVSVHNAAGGTKYIGHCGIVKGYGHYMVGLHGEAEGLFSHSQAIGVHGIATGGTTGIGGAFYGSGYDLMLYGTGVISWGGTDVSKPPGGVTQFLRADGQWSAAPICKGQPFTLTIPAQGGNPAMIFYNCVAS